MATAAVRAALLCACALLLQHASAELRGRCPAEESACPARATPCKTDDECGEQVCCSSTCGRVCVDPLYTGCENIKLSSERISRALAAENSRGGRGMIRPVRTPRCRTSDGEFEEIQCDNEIVSSCWCVDAAGFEVPGTRAPAAALVNCTRTAPCAAHTCRMLCPLGFELDPRGCPLCKCRDPCASITCPGQLSCQLEETPCLRPPCPPVPTCKRGRSLQNICPAGEPLLISETSRPFLCGTDPGKPNCPPLYRCLVETGNDYGVCCPASLELQKAGTCPAPSTSTTELDCGTPCAHDLECPSMQKCCDGGECGRHCTLPHNVTMCTQQKMLAELLVVSEKEGRGYVPQCTIDGSFESRQCSRNGLVCWCVDSDGNKLRGSMGPSASVHCSLTPAPARTGGRSLESSCSKALCAGVCEYGYKIGADGCPTCECDDPCAGFPCADGEECVRVKDADCSGELCTGYPVCRPRISYENPCEVGAPLSDDDGAVVTCGGERDCPAAHVCSRQKRSTTAVCCPDPHYVDSVTDGDVVDVSLESCSAEAEALCGLNSTVICAEGICEHGLVCCSTSSCGPVCVDAAKMRLQSDRVDDTPTMCEYLRDFDEKMEGTVDGMKLALPAPTCKPDGSFSPQQCADGRCWCVDSFGTEIPDTSTNNASAVDCDKVREQLECLDLTCRMGCDYGFELGANKCPTCRCRDPCAGVTCADGRACAVVDVACDADYCPPVPACLPRKPGQCPYLVPTNGACEWGCRTDTECATGERCCATGCGTACTKPVHQTVCQQRRAIALHAAAESGNPPAWNWIPECKEDGVFAQVQCRGSDKTCWCVDAIGNEVPGTRAKNSTPNCDSPAKCPDPGCYEGEICPYGRDLDENGCPICECRDLCADAKCIGSEYCELVPLDCEGECTPVGTCRPPPQCPGGAEPLMAPGGETALECGPNAAACPSTHACRFVPHDTRAPVCCPKPRTVCFESKDEGMCVNGNGLNTTRWFFNHELKRCERFNYHGCSGNHNNFRTKEECNAVCPVEGETAKLTKKKNGQEQKEVEVLTPCERLREKNEAAAQKYGKGTFIPKCDTTGAWENVQCMSHIDVCWCVSARGEPMKGSLVRGAKPTCNFRQARKWIRRDPLDERARADEVLEELIRQMTAYRIDEFEENDDEDDPDLEAEGRHIDHSDQDTAEEILAREDETLLRAEVVEPQPAETLRTLDKPLEIFTVTENIVFKTKCQMVQEEAENGGEGPRPRCMSDGSFSPRQCSRGRCWCVDAAGQRRWHAAPVPDLPHPDPCELTQIESASLELELLGVENTTAERARATLSARLAALGSRVPVTMSKDKNMVKLRAVINGPKAVDVVYHMENLVKQEKMSGNGKSGDGTLGADVIRSEYRLAASAPAMQQREILSESTVSAATSYHTALIVLAATSAFIISVLCVLVMLYRARLQREPQKAERFLPAAPPVYVLSADEKAELARVLHAPPPVLPQPSTEEDHTRV